MWACDVPWCDQVCFCAPRFIALSLGSGKSFLRKRTEEKKSGGRAYLNLGTTAPVWPTTPRLHHDPRTGWPGNLSAGPHLEDLPRLLVWCRHVLGSTCNSTLRSALRRPFIHRTHHHPQAVANMVGTQKKGRNHPVAPFLDLATAEMRRLLVTAGPAAATTAGTDR